MADAASAGTSSAGTAPSPAAPVPSGTGVPRDILRSAVELCLDLHAHPELSGAEQRTADRLADRLARDGLTVTRSVGGHGVVGVRHNGAGPTVLLRAELDALPVTERTGLPYASTVPGVMHACGHDLHLAAAAGAAALLLSRSDRWSGTLLVVGQPAEETLAGARAMLADGLYRRFGVPDVVLAQHTAPLPAGTVAHGGGGPVLAGSAALEVVIHGSGGHAGTPQLTVDPVVTAAAVVLRLQTVVSRETSPAEQVALTVGSLRAGELGNVVPDRAELSISVRAFSEAALDRVTAAVRRIVSAECAASGCLREPEITVAARSPVLEPDAAATAAVRAAHQEAFGARRVLPWPASMAAEDFGWFGGGGSALHGAGEVRTVYWMLGATGARQWQAAEAEAEAAAAAQRPGAEAGGAAPPGTQPDSLSPREAGSARSPAPAPAAVRAGSVPANHAPEFAPDIRTALPTGISAMVAAALRSWREGSR